MLEQRLLAFINDTLLKDGAAVDVDSRLFEDGHIDSIRVLDLIAFVERSTGRKVPDRLVRLSTFRSVRAIATTFDKGEPTDAGPERVHEYPASHPDIRSPIQELVARNELSVTAEGGVSLGGDAHALLEFFDAAVDGWASELKADTRTVPSHISQSILDRAEVTAAFPQLLVRDAEKEALTPAACYHCYPELSGHSLRRERS